MQTPNNGLQGPTWASSLFPNPLLSFHLFKYSRLLAFPAVLWTHQATTLGPCTCWSSIWEALTPGFPEPACPLCADFHSAFNNSTSLLDHPIQTLINVLAASPNILFLPLLSYPSCDLLLPDITLFLNCLISVLKENRSTKGCLLITLSSAHSTVPSHNRLLLHPFSNWLHFHWASTLGFWG